MMPGQETYRMSAATSETASLRSLAKAGVSAITIAGIVVGLACGLLACGGPVAPPSSTGTQAARPAWQVRPLGGAQPIDPGIAPGTAAATPAGARQLLDANGCATCHAEIVAEWSTSRHALAWTNGIFQREYSEQPLAWCVNCHA